ncbi:MAG: malonyl-CoA synthase [Pseudomonadota bacterium]
MSNTLYDRLIAPQSENKACFLACDGRDDLSFAAFVEQAAQLAHVLVAQGVAPGDRVVVQAPKCPEMFALFAATIQAGAVFLPLNTAYTRDEVAYFATDASPRLMIVSEKAAPDLADIAAQVGATLLTLNSDGSGSLTDGLAAYPTIFATVSRAEDDLAALLYTSGTTGRSKGAMLSHLNLASNAETLVGHWQITSNDVLIHALPIFHTHGLFVALNTALFAGAKVRFMERFDRDAILDALPQSTLMMGVPTFYTRLLDDARLTAELTASMRLFISGSAPLLAETHTAFTARTGHKILERYGMSETNMNTSNPFDGERRPGTVGMPLPGVEIRLTDPETGESVAEGGIGMIEVRGPNVFQGYWNMPEKTAAELREDGFFISGDLGQFSPDGYLSIVGRSKDLIITGGYNVYPKEVEDVLNGIEGVGESAVFGVPEPDFGEAIIAAVVPEAGADLVPEALAEVVGAKLARFKHPRRYEIIPALPRNAMGKVQKNELRDTYKAG